MLFTSSTFVLFFIIVYGLYVILNHKWQNRLLLIASCIFYGSWDWRFLALMFVSLTTDYFCAIQIEQSTDQKTKKTFLIISLVVNLFILGFFKYFNFFATGFVDLLNHFGLSASFPVLHIILPVGISFYTFQAMGYVIDVYRGDLRAVRRYQDYALFVTFFPQLVAGPIMRAKDMLPQILSSRQITIQKLREGGFLILWGCFQKVFVADNLARTVNLVFSSPPPYEGIHVVAAMYAFAFQIYCDFAGYSNIARGLGRWLGFDLINNFNFPYFSQSAREFWQRWHISLSTWLRDYVYIPLGGNRGGLIGTSRNLFLTMLIGGLWHGANWTFIFWGAYQGMLLIANRWWASLRETMVAVSSGISSRVAAIIKTAIVFHLICYGWLMFRSQNIQQFFDMSYGLFCNFSLRHGLNIKSTFCEIFYFIGLLVVVEAIQYFRKDYWVILKANRWIRYGFYYYCFRTLLYYGSWGNNPFIYFQF